MTRPPLISLVFFLAPALLLGYGASLKVGIAPPGTTTSQSRVGGEISHQTPARHHDEVGVNFATTFDPRYPYKPKTLSGSENDRAEVSFDPADEFWGLPQTSGYEAVAGLCVGCHSLEIVMQQKMTRKQWEATLVWMAEKQGMVQLDDQATLRIVNYLVEHFGESEGRR